MDDSDIVVLDSPPKEAPAYPVGIPRNFINDDLRRFSFGVESPLSSRRSLSQPVLGLDTLTDNQEKNDDVIMSRANQALLSPTKKRVKRPPSILNEFFGVYCLISRSTLKHYKNRCYIGYTVDPNRRINQHNGGREKGGAKKTDSKGPWDMVCIIHGFPNSVAALRFEWAWQNPDKSKAIKHLNLKKTNKETPFAFRLRVACHLLNSIPWCRFALTFRWLLVTEELPFPTHIPPPAHVGKAYGLVEKASSLIPKDESDYVKPGKCAICNQEIDRPAHLIRCLNSSCSVSFHQRCLAEHSLKEEKRSQMFPIKCKCVTCFRSYLWGDLIRYQRDMLKVNEAKNDNFDKNLVPRSLLPVA